MSQPDRLQSTLRLASETPAGSPFVPSRPPTQDDGSEIQFSPSVKVRAPQSLRHSRGGSSFRKLMWVLIAFLSVSSSDLDARLRPAGRQFPVNASSALPQRGPTRFGLSERSERRPGICRIETPGHQKRRCGRHDFDPDENPGEGRIV